MDAIPGHGIPKMRRAAILEVTRNGGPEGLTTSDVAWRLLESEYAGLFEYLKHFKCVRDTVLRELKRFEEQGFLERRGDRWHGS